MTDDTRDWLETPLGQFHRTAPVIEPAEAPKPPPSAEVIKLFPEKPVDRSMFLTILNVEKIEYFLGQPEFRQQVVNLHACGPHKVGYFIATLMAQAQNFTADVCSEGDDALIDLCEDYNIAYDEDTLAKLYDRPLKEWLDYFLDITHHLTTPRQVRK